MSAYAERHGLVEARGLLVEMKERGLHLLDVEGTPWESAITRESAIDGTPAVAPMDTSGVEEKILIRPEDGEDRPFVEIVRFPPNFCFVDHWHTEGEFVHVLKGTYLVGGHTVGPGGMAYNDARTIYGTEMAGPDGCEFLVVRRGWSKTTFVPEDREGPDS